MTERPDKLVMNDWDEWQSYRSDRNPPPWIKVHRRIKDNPKWARLSDAERGQLVCLWILAADDAGKIPNDPKLLRKLCMMDSEPDLQAFVSLGLMRPDVNVPSRRRQHDGGMTLARARSPEAEAEREAEADTHTHRARGEPDELATWLNGHGDLIEDVRFLDDEKRRTLWQHYGPPGLRSNAWKLPDGSSVPPPDRPRIFALTLSGYGLEGTTQFHANEFAGMLRRTIADELGQSTTRSNGGPF